MAYADFSRFVVTAANEPSARSPRIRCTPFPSIHLLHLLGSYKWQLYGFVLYGRLTKQSPALYAVSVRQARGLLTASFRFFLAEDTLAVQLYASSLPRRIRDFHPLGRAHGAHTIKKASPSREMPSGGAASHSKRNHIKKRFNLLGFPALYPTPHMPLLPP